MSSKANAVSAPDNPTVLIRYEPASAPLVLASSAVAMIQKVQSIKKVENAKQLEAISEIIDEARTTSDDVEAFLNKFRANVDLACAEIRKLRHFEDFEAGLVIRKWGVRSLLGSGITSLRNMRAKFLSDEEERVRREQLAKQAEQDRINAEAARKAAAEAKKQGADKATVAEIKQTVLATPAPIVTSKALESATSTVVYRYTAELYDLKKFLGLCLQNDSMLNTLKKAVPDIESAFRGMATDQKESFDYPGIRFKKTATDRR
jgi:hypothetical protein